MSDLRPPLFLMAISSSSRGFALDTIFCLPSSFFAAPVFFRGKANSCDGTLGGGGGGWDEAGGGGGEGGWCQLDGGGADAVSGCCLTGFSTDG